MTFQFMCPHGHLLQGDVSQMGHPCQCPHCGITFIIPTVEVQPQYAPQHQQPAPYTQYPDFTQQPAQPSGPTFPDFGAMQAHPESPLQQHLAPVHHEEPDHHDEPVTMHAPVDPAELQPQADPNIVHIPCPNGHELETPLDMIGQDVLCPHCGAQFKLRNEDSIEYRERQERILHARSEFWFKWSIAAAVVVLLGLVGMMVVISQR